MYWQNWVVKQQIVKASTASDTSLTCLHAAANVGFAAEVGIRVCAET